MAKKVKNKRTMSEEHKKKISAARTKYWEQKKDNSEDIIENNAKNNAKSVRGKPFEPGNALGGGRPKGARNRKTLFLEFLGDEVVTAANEHFKRLLMEGDMRALDLFIERTYPKPSPVAPHTFCESEFVLPSIKSGSDINDAMEHVLLAVEDGIISQEEGDYWYDKLERKVKGLAIFEWEPFIEKMLELKKRGGI